MFAAHNTTYPDQTGSHRWHTIQTIHQETVRLIFRTIDRLREYIDVRSLSGDPPGISANRFLTCTYSYPTSHSLSVLHSTNLPYVHINNPQPLVWKNPVHIGFSRGIIYD